jgi:hypothetical protein
VTDTHGPTISCPANVTVDCKASTGPAATGTATATDDCSGIKSITSSDTTTSGSCAGNYVIHRKWTAEDNCGSKSECTQDITVTDTHGPTISCPANVTVDCKASTASGRHGTATASDDCSGIKSITSSDTTTSGSCAGNYVIHRTWTARDNCGNKSDMHTGHHRDRHARADDQLPGQCDGGLQGLDPAGDTGTATASDDCSGVTSINYTDANAAGSCAGNHVITRTWKATDNCGNFSTCVQTITVTDTHGPVVTCPPAKNH